MSSGSGVSLIGGQAIAAAMKSGNINISGNVALEVLDLSNESREAQLRHAETLRKYEAQKRARSIVVPTSIEDVKTKLRELGHPVTLFGESHIDRRERIKEVIASLELGHEEAAKVQELINQRTGGAAPTAIAGTTTGSLVSDHARGIHKDVFYSPATEEMISARKQLCEISFTRARDRILRTKRIRDDDDLQAEEDRNVASLYSTCRETTLNSSQFGDERPLTAARYAASGGVLATGSLSCGVKVWSASDLSCKSSLRGHEDRITSLAWHPESFVSEGKALLVSASGDSTCKIWDCNGLLQVGSTADSSSGSSAMAVDGEVVSKVNTATTTVLHTLKGHQGVVNCCEFHPSGRFVGTASSDYSWRLWDVETGKELLLQDGHIKECNTIAFQQDGSLVLTADWAGVALLWDLRSGQEIHVFQGHVKKITSATFNANGFQLATGSVDNMVRIWDLRKKKCGYTLPAHSNCISDVRFSKSGETLVTSSFDGTLKLWGARDYQLLRSLSGHLGKVMSCDFSADEKHVVSAGYDRTIKIWAHKSEF